MKVDFYKPELQDEEEIKQLFKKTIRDNFHQEGIIQTHENDLINEIKSQIGVLRTFFNSQGEKEYYLLAKVEEKIVGTIAYGKANQIITKNLDAFSYKIPEVKSVYVLPKFQNKGIGTSLVSNIISKLRDRNIQEFYLDSGYKKAQQYWKKRLGNPICILKEYWGKDSDHMIWHYKIDEKIR